MTTENENMTQPPQPDVWIICRPMIDWDEIEAYLLDVVGIDETWVAPRMEVFRDGEHLAEIAGRICYRSWEPGLNPNVTKIRTDQAEYLKNIVKSGHGSVLEHINYSFIITGSRVFTHEWVRHRAGTAISQESMRYVRMSQGLPFWFPDWAKQDSKLIAEAQTLITHMEYFQTWASDHFGLDDLAFSAKKKYTSFMRRFIGDGVNTSLVWTANVRALRHIIAARTDKHAEEEIRIIGQKLGRIMQGECPVLFGDFTENQDGEWVPQWTKV